MSATSKRPFPPLPPASTSEAASIRSNDWSAFKELTSLEDHWTLKAWAPGRSGYYWYLTFDNPDLAALAGQCQKALADDDLDLMPTDGLHVTMMGVGNAQDVPDIELSRIVDATRERLSGFTPFDMSVGPLAGSRSAIRFSVAPWDPLLALHRALRAAASAFRPASRLPETSEFRPHLGIAYINRKQSPNELVSDVSALRHIPPVTVRVDKVDLVELRREGRRYRWHDRAVISLNR
ncbi:2'-5' RNA ligase family protein [Nocardia sp. NBC_00565]|uniref:2'-5' RNA ligase family protein n=1 Tax=Nocardia sp. NBC_00565 TaxID=2975993 RepID=UPI002E80D671|nr:2'-5' RNA ligase family protein [Nocardia sp. NBC_00565]WUC01323.1 2'-5' RNA ligase family protein [Nocardia sp. NBC_00565]